MHRAVDLGLWDLDGRQVEIADVQPELIINRVELFPPLGQLGLSLSVQPIQVVLVDDLINRSRAER